MSPIRSNLFEQTPDFQCSKRVQADTVPPYPFEQSFGTRFCASLRTSSVKALPMDSESADCDSELDASKGAGWKSGRMMSANGRFFTKFDSWPKDS
jgi:hypothetical protein